jgi:hypothetical protein
VLNGSWTVTLPCFRVQRGRFGGRCAEARVVDSGNLERVGDRRGALFGEVLERRRRKRLRVGEPAVESPVKLARVGNLRFAARKIFHVVERRHRLLCACCSGFRFSFSLELVELCPRKPLLEQVAQSPARTPILDADHRLRFVSSATSRPARFSISRLSAERLSARPSTSAS